MSSTDHQRGLAGILLAAGGSSRLGSPKQLLECEGENLLTRAINASRAQCPAGLFVVTGAARVPIETTLAGLPVSIVHNPEWQHGISTSIRCGVHATPAEAQGFLLLLCDQPRIGSAELAALVNAWESAPESIAAAGYAGTRGVPAVFPGHLRSALENLQGDRGARALIESAAEVTVVDMPAAAFDIDTLDDVRKLNAPPPGG